MKNGDALIRQAEDWFGQKSWQPFGFQLETWVHYLDGKHGLLNAPTGSGKTFALLVPIFLEALRTGQPTAGVQAIWITPIRALAREIQSAALEAMEGLGVKWEVGIRTGDTGGGERTRQKKNAPGLLITTPESLHLLLASKGYPEYFRNLKSVICDEWHELMGSKRGVQMELALSRLKGFVPGLKIWGISATLANLQEAADVLFGESAVQQGYALVKAPSDKKIECISILPETIETYPWAGHLGIRMLTQLLPVIENSKATLLFTNTRAQCEIWYRALLEAAPDLAGAIAMHHSSLSREVRDWVENALHEGILKVVVCTSSLDLGVDFRPVETVVQIGSPKGVGRCLQRAGRSGHCPGGKSRIYFVPTHSLELIEGAALREAIGQNAIEARLPYLRSFDVLVQYLVSLAVSEGFEAKTILKEVRGTYSFASISETEWGWALDFITRGGSSLDAYEAFKKVQLTEGRYHVESRQTAMRHRLQIGTIVSDTGLLVKYLGGGSLGTIEERFAGMLEPGEIFWFGGKSLEFVRIKDMTVQVRRSNQKNGKVPSWLGGRMPLSSQLSEFLRKKIDDAARGVADDEELKCLRPLFEVQRSRSKLPLSGELLIEYFQSREGFHLLVYPFEGRFVHEGMSALLAYRISRLRPISFSIAMNDYGFELLSDSEIPIEEALRNGLFSSRNLGEDIEASINATELSKRRFRDIAGIAGLVFKGFPGKHKKERHLQASSQLFFGVFQEYEPDNLLFLQAYDEVRTFQLEEGRLRGALERIGRQEIVLTRPGKATPFSFPIIVDRLRERLSSEKLEDRIRKMKLQLEK